MKKGISILFFAVMFSVSAFSQKYTGNVYVDSNHNGMFDRGEKTLSRVAVSDGLNVVLTDPNGNYTLQGHKKERFVYITTPSGYKTNNEYYKRISSDINEYNFGVIPDVSAIGKDGSHSFIHISDTEIHNETIPECEDWVADIQEAASNEKASFIVQTGDICYENGLKNHIAMMNTENMGTQVFYTLGNHDLVKGDYGEQLYESLYGPVCYSFDVGSVHYIVTPMLSGDYAPSFKKKDVIDWLKNDLAVQPEGKPIMVFNHELYLVFDKSFDFLREYNLKAWLYGHWHVNLIREYDGVYGVCTSTPARGGIDHSSSAYRIMNIDTNGDFRSDLRYAYIDNSLVIASVDPVSVNTYSAVTHTREVKYSCKHEGKTLFKGKRLKQNADWNWSAELELPEVYDGKRLTMVVEAIFDNETIAKAEQSFIYRKKKNSVTLNGDWTNLLGNAEHVGISKDTLFKENKMQDTLDLQWVKNIGSNIYMTSPIIMGEVVYVASVDENKSGKASVCALNALNGEIVWQYPTKNSVKNTIVGWEAKSGKGSVMAQDVEGNLYCIDAKSGKLSWEIKLKVKLVPGLNDGIVVKDGVVYAGTGEGLCAVDIETGMILWENADWSQGDGTMVTSTIYPLGLVGQGEGVLIGGVQWRGMYANDLKSGKLLWSNKDSDVRFRASSPSVYNGLLCFVSKDAFLMLNPLNGKVVVRKVLPLGLETTSTPLITDDEIIFGSAADGLIALDNKTFEIKWKFKTADALIYSSPYVRGPASTVETSPVLSGNTVFFGASDGVFYGINRSTGKLLWKHETGAPIFGAVAISGNALYGIDFSGNVYCFTAP